MHRLTDACIVKHLISCFPIIILQDPAEADKLLKIQRDLDETKIILVSNSIAHELIYPDCNLYPMLAMAYSLFQCAWIHVSVFRY